MKFLENMLKKLEFSEEKTKIYNKTPKLFSWNPKYWLKGILRWFKFRDSSGELLVKEETNINEVILIWIKDILVWLFDILVTGTLIQLAILPFYNPGLKLIAYSIFSFGLIVYVIVMAWNGFITGLSKVATASRR